MFKFVEKSSHGELMSDKSERGKRKGFLDARERKYQISPRATEPWVHVVPETLESNVPEDEYRLGYAAGFDEAIGGDRLTLKHTELITNTPMTGATNVPNATSYAYQIELLENLKQYLTDFQERLLAVSANYQRKVDALHDEGGLMDETYRDFVEQQLEPTRVMIARLVEHIGNYDIPAVQNEINYLEPKV
jgi:hypothetical protein